MKRWYAYIFVVLFSIHQLDAAWSWTDMMQQSWQRVSSFFLSEKAQPLLVFGGFVGLVAGYVACKHWRAAIIKGPGLQDVLPPELNILWITPYYQQDNTTCGYHSVKNGLFWLQNNEASMKDENVFNSFMNKIWPGRFDVCEVDTLVDRSAIHSDSLSLLGVKNPSEMLPSTGIAYLIDKIKSINQTDGSPLFPRAIPSPLSSYMTVLERAYAFVPGTWTPQEIAALNRLQNAYRSEQSFDHVFVTSTVFDKQDQDSVFRSNSHWVALGLSYSFESGESGATIVIIDSKRKLMDICVERRRQRIARAVWQHVFNIVSSDKSIQQQDDEARALAIYKDRVKTPLDILQNKYDKYAVISAQKVSVEFNTITRQRTIQDLDWHKEITGERLQVPDSVFTRIQRSADFIVFALQNPSREGYEYHLIECARQDDDFCEDKWRELSGKYAVKIDESFQFKTDEECVESIVQAFTGNGENALGQFAIWPEDICRGVREFIDAYSQGEDCGLQGPAGQAIQMLHEKGREESGGGGGDGGEVEAAGAGDCPFKEVE